MKVVGKKVEHKAFGQGTITEHSGNIVTVSFSKEEKKFIFPDAFVEFLTFKEKSDQDEVDKICNKKIEKKKAQKKAQVKKQKRRRRLLSLKITPKSQAAFNIEADDLDEIFSTGTISTGVYLSGRSKGKPRIPSKLRPNSVCLLTGRTPDASEKERQILGVLMVKDDFFGNACEDGIVKLHEHYRIRLAPDKRMRYWDYFEGSDPLPRWGNTAFKYFANSTMQKILKDMKKKVQNAEEGKEIDSFYEYFCEINHLNENS